ncbi:MAG: acyl-CoA dehydrogenase family protein [Acidimicrobiales bacterium]
MSREAAQRAFEQFRREPGTVIKDAEQRPQVVRVCAPGFAGVDAYHVGVFAWALCDFGAIYDGIARRAFAMTVESIPQKTSIALGGSSMATHPEVQHHVAEMRMALDANEALLTKVTTDWASGVAHEDWPVRILALRQRVVDDSFRVVDTALDLTGGGGAFKRSRMEQMFRDARMGRFHPGNTFLAHEVIGKLCLGVDPDAEKRWG